MVTIMAMESILFQSNCEDCVYTASKAVIANMKRFFFGFYGYVTPKLTLKCSIKKSNSVLISITKQIY